VEHAVIGNLLFFGIGGLALLVMGLWGLRRAGRLSAVDGWDEDSREQRRGVLRRGCFTCMALGAVFLAIAAAAPFLSPGR
jgi:hypothetical protein